MRILVNDFAGHPFPFQLSRALARHGHSVLHTYFAANNTPKGMTDAVEQDFIADGITIGREFKKHSLLSRRGADIRYGRAVSERVSEFRPDVVISGNMPLDAQRVLLATTQSCGGAFVFWLQDVLSVGIEFVLRKKHVPFAGLAGSYYRRIERQLLQKSDAVVCIAPEFREAIVQWQIDPEKIYVIENWAPLDEVYPLPPPIPWPREQNIQGRFCFMYSGTLGMKHKPDLLLELARRFESRDDVAVVVIAQGAGADWLRDNQHRIRPGVLHLLPFQPYERLAEVLASSDVLITLLDEQCGNFAVPSKTLAYLCAGRPILLAGPEDNLAARIIRSADAGLVVGTSASEFVSAATKLLEDEQLRRKCAVQARCYAERTFGIEGIEQKFMRAVDFGLSARKCQTRIKHRNAPIVGAGDRS